MTETGVQEIDDLHFGLLPEKEWVLLEGSRRTFRACSIPASCSSTPSIPIRASRPRTLSRLPGKFLHQFERAARSSTADDLLGYARAQLAP